MKQNFAIRDWVLEVVLSFEDTFEVFGHCLEAYKSSKMLCPWLENSIIS